MSNFALYLGLNQDLLRFEEEQRRRHPAVTAGANHGTTVGSVLRSLRARISVEPAESPSMPTLIDYPSRS